jgi:hypothetical protein
LLKSIVVPRCLEDDRRADIIRLRAQMLAFGRRSRTGLEDGILPAMHRLIKSSGPPWSRDFAPAAPAVLF